MEWMKCTVLLAMSAKKWVNSPVHRSSQERRPITYQEICTKRATLEKELKQEKEKNKKNGEEEDIIMINYCTQQLKLRG